MLDRMYGAINARRKWLRLGNFLINEFGGAAAGTFLVNDCVNASTTADIHHIPFRTESSTRAPLFGYRALFLTSSRSQNPKSHEGYDRP